MKYAVYDVGYVYNNVNRKTIWSMFDELSKAEQYAYEMSELYHHVVFEIIELPTVADLPEDDE